MRNFVMGDVHGGYKALLQCLDRSKFDYTNDQLIQLGDITDSFPQVYECVEELLKIRNLIALEGNHDNWFDEFIKTDFHPYFWNYGGKGTLISYLEHAGKKGRYFSSGSGFKTALTSGDIPESHKRFFADQMPYYVDEKNRCFVHGGFKMDVLFYEQKITDYYWDRSLWKTAWEQQERKEDFVTATSFYEIYLGHTPTTKFGSDKPLTAFDIHNVDTGGGHLGRLTIMDIDSKEFWQSDLLSELYPEH